MPDGDRRNLPGWRRLLGHIAQHVREDWPATIFVAALFAVLDHSVGWLDAINGHGFLAIGNAAGIPHVGGAGDVKALVVQIDQAAAESRYLDRSPLDRCELHADLGAVYSAMKKHRLDLLVVDLDLSPARWLLTDNGSRTAEAGCQSALYRTIKEAAAGEPKVRTVLMQPIEAADPVLRARQNEWRAEIEGPGVTLAHAVLPVNYGLVIKQYCDPHALAAAAYRQAAPPGDLRCAEPRFIDPRKYVSGVIPLPLSALADGAGTFEGRLGEALRAHGAGDEAGRAGSVRAVFFGAAYGQGDTFVTPLGELYGVEIHAAGFLSHLDPILAENRLTELLVDIAYGFFFGFLIALFWERYFELRLSENSDLRLAAPLWLFGLALTIVFCAVLLTFISWWLLARFGLWLSPIPMAIGMLIESFASGSVAQGIRQANLLKGAGPPSSSSFRESAVRFFGGIFLLARKGKKLSAFLLTLRLGIWLATVAGALYLALH